MKHKQLMKIKMVRKQRKIQNYPRRRYVLSDMPIIDRESLSIKTNKDGVVNISAKLVCRSGIAIPSPRKILDKEVAITVQELANRNVIGPESLVKVLLKGHKLERAGGVWPPYMVTLEKGTVMNVELIKKK